MISKLAIKNWTVGNCATKLHQVHDDDINIAIYNRDIPPILNEIERLVNQSVEFRANGKIDSIIGEIIKELGQYEILTNDLVSLLTLFKEITKNSSFSLLLATVNTNMCRKFHTDINDLRLLCTYCGPGTLWL